MTTRPDRDAINLAHAILESRMAVCTRRQVGAVITAGDPPHIIGTGYNGTGSGKPHCSTTEKGCERGLRSTADVPPGGDYNAPGWRCSAVHAEHNAVLGAIEAVGKAALRGATLYSTDAPCSQCAVLIEAVGIARVITPEDVPAVQLDRLLRMPVLGPKTPHLPHQVDLSFVDRNRVKARFPLDDPPICERKGCGHLIGHHLYDKPTDTHSTCTIGCGCQELLRGPYRRTS